MSTFENNAGPKVKTNQQLTGHRRLPTIGKTMAVTDLLLSISPQSASSIRSRDSCERSDGQHFNNSCLLSNMNKYDQDDKGEDDRGFEMCDSSINVSELQKPCLICTGSAPIGLATKPLAINQMCHILCNESCRSRLSLTGTRPSNLRPNATLTHSIKRPVTQPELGPILEATPQCDNNNEQKEISKTPPAVSSLPSGNQVALLRQKFLFDLLNEKPTDVGCFAECCPPTNLNNLVLEEDFHEKSEIAEALAKMSILTSTTQIKQRLAARKLQAELENENASTQNGSEYEPPRELLLYLVRMGSFNSAPKILNIDSQDDGLQIPKGLSTNELLQHVKQLRGDKQPPLLTRYFLNPLDAQMVSSDITDGLRYLKLASVSKVCSPQVTPPNQIRLLQWNILSQTLGQNNDGFVCCPEQALTWENRKFLIVQEILQTNPDIICLQEVDHFKFLQNILGTQNYEGTFYPKPDSPCLYIEENNGPDGCAIFFKRNKYELINSDTRILEVWRVQSNQVAIGANLRIKGTGTEISVCTTHLKARHGSLLSKLRNEQGRDLLRFVKQFAEERPVLLCGDFNAEPTEPVYSTILNCDILKLSSAYADIKDEVEKYSQDGGAEEEGDEPTDESDKILSSIKREPSYTTWKIRENGEECHTIDYVFYSKDLLKVKNCLEFPQDDEIGKNRTPSFQYPSDHFSLVCDFEIVELKQETQKEN